MVIGLVFCELELGATVRALGVTGFLDGEIDARVCVPKHHLRRWATQWELASLDLIGTFGIRWQVLVLSVAMGIWIGSSHGHIVP
jgi:hypothetical protein